jgi:MscS family membrane protein
MTIISFKSIFYQIFILVFLSSVLTILLNFVFKKLKKLSEITKNNWDDIILESIEKPLLILIWAIVSEVIFANIYQVIYQKNLAIFSDLIAITITFFASWFLIRIVNNFISSKKDALANQLLNKDIEADIIIEKLAKITIFVITTLIIIQILGFNISAILAAGGAGGLVVGFAAKDVFANLFGGLTVHLDKPFNIGDWIRCQEKSIEGIVEYIGWRHTRIRAFNANPIYVPNSIFTSAVVENPSRMTHRRIREFIGIRYCDITKMQIITDSVKNLMKNHSMIDQEKTIIVSFDKFNNSSIDFLVYGFVRTNNWQIFSEAKQEILLSIAKIIEQNQAEIAFPTQTIYLNQEKLENKMLGTVNNVNSA